MIVNPGKFQAIIKRFGKMENKYEMYIDDKKITEHFNYCPFGWHFSSMASTNKQNQYKKELFDCYIMTILAPMSYLAKANKPSMEPKHYRTLALKIFKTLNILNPLYVQDLFYLQSSSASQPNNPLQE